MPPKTNEELIEVTAKRIYEVMPYDLPGIKPEWVGGGNSLMQSIARGCASGILTTILTTKDQELQKAKEEEREETREILRCISRMVEINATNLENYILGQMPIVQSELDHPNK